MALKDSAVRDLARESFEITVPATAALEKMCDPVQTLDFYKRRPLRNRHHPGQTPRQSGGLLTRFGRHP